MKQTKINAPVKNIKVLSVDETEVVTGGCPEEEGTREEERKKPPTFSL